MWPTVAAVGSTDNSSFNVTLAPFVSAGQWSVSPKCGWSRSLPSPGLKAPFPPSVHPSALPGPSSTRLACLPHLQVYKKNRGEKKDFNDIKRLSSHTAHTTRGLKILPDFTCFKGEQKTKKAGKRTSCYTEVLYLGTWKQGCFHTFFSEIMHTLNFFFFFCCLNLCISAIRLKCVYLSPPEAFVLITSAQCYGLILEDFLLEFFFPVIHTDVVALHYIENLC